MKFLPTCANIDLDRKVKQKESRKIRLGLNVGNISWHFLEEMNVGTAICNEAYLIQPPPPPNKPKLGLWLPSSLKESRY